MKFLADQDVYAATIRFLSGLGHDVVSAASLGLARAEDAELLRVAHEQGRIFVTRDRDFGGLVFVQGSGPGVIYRNRSRVGSLRKTSETGWFSSTGVIRY